MIKFFRNIRRQLLGEGKTGRYLKYAIGEIVLVVIGILIALSINNWNENRKINNDITLLFTALESELENNIKETSRLINYGHLMDSISTLFRENRVTREMIRNDPRLAYSDYRTRSTFLEEERLDEVIAQEKQLSSQNKALLPIIKLLKRRIKAWRFWQDKTLELSMQRSKELASKTPYIEDSDSLAIENIITRSLNDKIYRSEVEDYLHYQLNENVWEANLIRTSSVVLLWELKTAKEKDLNIEIFLKGLNLDPFIEFLCDKDLNKKYETNFRRNVIVYNNQDIEVSLKRHNKNIDDIDIFLIPAKSFLNVNIHSNVYFELEKDGKCDKVFDANKEDFIIL